MKKLIIAVFFLCAFRVSAQTPVLSPATPVVNQGQTQTFTCTSNCGTGGVWSVSGTDSSGNSTSAAGSINSSTGVYTAPATVNAQQSYGGWQLLPNNHIYNTRIDSAPVNANSATWMASEGGLTGFIYFQQFPVNYVTSATPTVTLTPKTSLPGGTAGTYTMPIYPNRKDQGGYFFSPNSGDKHIWTVDTGTGIFEESYQYTVPVGILSCAPTCNTDGQAKYQNSTYTAQFGDPNATGTAMMPLTLKIQEVENAVASGGTINHAMVFTLKNNFIAPTAFVWPAQVTSLAGFGQIPYGSRFRLKSSFSISGFSPIAQILLTQLKQYGFILTDGGAEFNTQIEMGAWPKKYTDAMSEIGAANITGGNFEIIDESGLMVSSTSGECTCNREIVSFTSSTGTTTVDVALQGVTVNVGKELQNIQAGTPAQQLVAYVNGGATNTLNWTISPSAVSPVQAGDVANAGTSSYPLLNTATTAGHFFAFSGFSQDTISTISVTATGCTVPTFTNTTSSPKRGATTSAYMLYAVNIPAGCIFTIHTSGSTTAGFSYAEYDLPATSSVFDCDSAGTGIGTAMSSGSCTTTNANDLILVGGGLKATSPSLGPDGLYTVAANRNGSSQSEILENKYVATTGSYSGAPTSTKSGEYVTILAAFKLASTAPTLGSITSGGIYTPPSTVPLAGSATVTATSADNSSVFATMVLNVLPAGTMRIILGNLAGIGVGTNPYVDAGSNTWSEVNIADCFLISVNAGGSWSGTDSSIYRYPCFEGGDIRVDVSVPNGGYTVTTKVGLDIVGDNNTQSFEAQGVVSYSNINILTQGGGSARVPLDFVMPTVVTNGLLSVVVRQGQTSTHRPFMSAISIVPMPINQLFAPPPPGVLIQ